MRRNIYKLINHTLTSSWATKLHTKPAISVAQLHQHTLLNESSAKFATYNEQYRQYAILDGSSATMTRRAMQLKQLPNRSIDSKQAHLTCLIKNTEGKDLPSCVSYLLGTII